MKLYEAIAELKKLSENKYRCLRYDVTAHEDGEIIVECTVYVDGYNHHSGGTWEEALLSLEYAMYPERKPVPEIDDI